MDQKFSQTQTQTQQQTQIQTLAPQQLIYVRLLELPVSDLETRVKNEILDNPVLEESGSTEQNDSNDENTSAENTEDTDFSADSNENYHDEEDYYKERRADYADDDDTPAYLLHTSDGEHQEQSYIPVGAQESFYENLIAQIGEHDVTDKQRTILEYIIGSLDSDGLLRKDLETISDEMAIYNNLDASSDEIREVLHILQTFDPPGIAATSLQECLLLQLHRTDKPSKELQLAIKIIQDSFEDFTHKRFDRLCQRHTLTRAELEVPLHILRKLNPRPGSGLNDTQVGNTQILIPDFIVKQNEAGEFDVSLNNGNVPTLHVSNSYRESLSEYTNNRKNLSKQQKEEFSYMKQKVDSAQNFINAIMQRRDTLLRTMRTIVNLQKPFFEEGDETLLYPMILKDVAEKTGLDISTISRVSQSKYVSTEFGVFPLKYFFNDSFVTSKGEALSKLKIKSKLREFIEDEDKDCPLSDEILADMLKQANFPVARRTVAKYREQLGFPVARLRRK